MVVLLGDSAPLTLCVCVHVLMPLGAMAQHLPPLVLGTTLPDVPTHLGILVTSHLASPRTPVSCAALNGCGSGLERAEQFFEAKYN